MNDFEFKSDSYEVRDLTAVSQLLSQLQAEEVEVAEIHVLVSGHHGGFDVEVISVVDDE